MCGLLVLIALSSLCAGIPESISILVGILLPWCCYGQFICSCYPHSSKCTSGNSVIFLLLFVYVSLCIGRQHVISVLPCYFTLQYVFIGRTLSWVYKTTHISFFHLAYSNTNSFPHLFVFLTVWPRRLSGREGYLFFFSLVALLKCFESIENLWQKSDEV